MRPTNAVSAAALASWRQPRERVLLELQLLGGEHASLDEVQQNPQLGDPAHGSGRR